VIYHHAIPHSPGSLANVSEQIRNAMIEAGQTVESARFKSDQEYAAAGNGA